VNYSESTSKQPRGKLYSNDQTGGAPFWDLECPIIYLTAENISTNRQISSLKNSTLSSYTLV